MRIRRFEVADAAGCALVFFRAVHEGAADHYTPEQRAAWAPKRPEADAFAERFTSEHCFVAEDARTIQGFMSLQDSGHLSMAFVGPEHRGTGLAAQLYDAILAQARLLGLTTLDTQASRLARPFFARRGWQVVAEEEVIRDGVRIPRTLMKLALSG